MMNACDNMVAYAFTFLIGSGGLCITTLTIIGVIEWWKGNLND